MPIRINLKELFPADPQQITVDKINFNFNKLLELGIGDQGLRGFSGIQGAAGPIGIQGNEGVRGNAWFVDSVADPNTLTFADLLVGDFYLDSQNFAVWQYDGTSWQFVFDLTEVINNYLSASSTPFVRGLGIGSPNDDRFILFNKRGNTPFDSSQDIVLGAAPAGNNSNNDILFLNNFNEDFLDSLTGFDFGPALTPIGDQVPTMGLFNSLLSVYVDHHSVSASQLGRYHLELGSLYLDGSEKKLTDVVDNLKVKFYTLPSVNSFSDYYNTVELSLDKPDDPTFSRKTNSLFHFRSAKWNDGGGVDAQFDLYVGSKFALDETVGTSGITKVDGIVFNESSVLGNIGTAYRYDINEGAFPDETGYVTNVAAGLNASYLMLDTIGNSTAGILIDSKTLQDGGNLIQLATTQPREIDNVARDSARLGPNSYLGNVGIAVRGDQVYTVSGEPAPLGLLGSNSHWGYFNRFGIENPNSPISDFTSSNSKFDGRTGAVPVVPPCNSVTPTISNQPIGPGISDLKLVGKYAYAVNNQSYDRTTADISFGSTFTTQVRRTYFQILETEAISGTSIDRVSRLGQGSYLGSTNLLGPGPGGVTDLDPAELNCAYRVEIAGKHAIIARNALPYATDSGTIELNNPNYTGGLAAIDISDPTAPKIVFDYDNVWNRTGANNTTVYGTSSILDTCLLGDTLFSLSFLQDDGAASVGYQVVVKSYDIKSLSDSTPTITKKGVATAAISSGVATLLTYQTLPRKGAIVANEQYIYAGYDGGVYVYLNSNSSKATDCDQRYSKIEEISLTFPVGYTKPEIFDMEQLGNSLYVLAKADSGGIPTAFVFKIDVSGGLENTRTGFSAQNPLTQIYRKEIVDGLGGRFAVVGKHIYVALVSETASDTNQPGLLALDFDGLYTGGAHIESLRSEKVEITKSLSIGDELTLHGDAEIGGAVFISDELYVSQDLIVAGDTYLEGDLDVAGDTTLQGNLDVVGDSTLQGDLTVGGETILEGNLTVDGDVDVAGEVTIDDGLQASGNVRLFSQVRTNFGSMRVADNLPPPNLYGKWVDDLDHQATSSDPGGVLGTTDSVGASGDTMVGIPTTDSLFIAPPFIHPSLPHDRLIFLSISDGGGGLNARAELWVESAPGSNLYYQQFRAYGLSSAQGIVPANCRFGILGKSESAGINVITWHIYKLGV